MSEPEPTPRASLRSALTLTVLVGALGYFVDIFDLLLFPIVRQASLASLGVAPEDALRVGEKLLSFQMGGMLVGGLVWGVLGDKKGRKSVLFGSIALYSLANLANAFVTSVPQYAAVRFLAGFGLAGELGAAITLVSETIPKESRAYGTTIVASVGVSGAVVAALIGKYMTWKVAYVVGGLLGLCLLALRIGVGESGMFDEAKASEVERGSLKMLVNDWQRFTRYLRCILIGMPLWYGIGILIVFSPEFGRVLGVQGEVKAAMAIAVCYAGLTIGDFTSGAVSHVLASRKKAVALFLSFTLAGVLTYANAHGITLRAFYTLCGFLGFAFGYWAVFVTVASEQFGTNLRATVTTTVPNFVRGSVVPLTMAFEALRTRIGLVEAALALGLGCIAIAFLSLWGMEETHGKDLDFVEGL